MGGGDGRALPGPTRLLCRPGCSAPSPRLLPPTSSRARLSAPEVPSACRAQLFRSVHCFVTINMISTCSEICCLGSLRGVVCQQKCQRPHIVCTATDWHEHHV